MAALSSSVTDRVLKHLMKDDRLVKTWPRVEEAMAEQLDYVAAIPIHVFPYRVSVIGAT